MYLKVDQIIDLIHRLRDNNEAYWHALAESF